ncbi:MAG: VPDSG-CTERM sorting domain-containing protein, partial [Limisphaerales bacterium]
LADAPKAYLPYFSGDMGQAKADQISKLWGMAFSPTMSANAAAAMQLAIWEIVAGDMFTITSSTDYGAAALIAQLPGYNGPKANLIALTGGGQDYVIATVPEAGATLVLLGLGVCGLAAFRRVRV